MTTEKCTEKTQKWLLKNDNWKRTIRNCFTYIIDYSTALLIENIVENKINYQAIKVFRSFAYSKWKQYVQFLQFYSQHTRNKKCLTWWREKCWYMYMHIANLNYKVLMIFLLIPVKQVFAVKKNYKGASLRLVFVIYTYQYNCAHTNVIISNKRNRITFNVDRQHDLYLSHLTNNIKVKCVQGYFL